MTLVLERRQPYEDTETQGECLTKTEDWSDVPISQETPGATRS